MDWAISDALSESTGRTSAVEPQRVFAFGCDPTTSSLAVVGLPLRSAVWSVAALGELREAGAEVVVLGPALVASERPIPELLKELREAAPLCDACVWAPDAPGGFVREALRAGAVDVVLERDPQALGAVLLRILRGAGLDEDAGGAGAAPALPEAAEPFEGMLSRSAAMFRLFETVKRVSPTEATVLLLGETGTGKELLARAVHKLSERQGRFVAVNCGAVPESLIDSELFGHEKGSFTGASATKTGLFRHADKGTLLLDEVGDLPPSAQLSLLRVLQEGKVRPVGGSEEIPVDVRVIAATSVPLYEKVERGQFREDLLYRLDVIRLVVPPLRERPEDVLFLFEHFCRDLAEQHGVEAPRLSQSFVESMAAYPWPGNVRQLENFTERLLLTRRAPCLSASHFRELIRPYRGERLAAAGPGEAAAQAAASGLVSGAPVVDGLAELESEIDISASLEDFLVPVCVELERRYLRAALRKNEGRLQATANTAGLSRRTLQRKLKKHGIDRRAFR